MSHINLKQEARLSFGGSLAHSSSLAFQVAAHARSQVRGGSCLSTVIAKTSGISDSDGGFDAATDDRRTGLADIPIACKVSSFCDTLALCMEKKGSLQKKADNAWGIAFNAEGS